MGFAQQLKLWRSIACILCCLLSFPDSAEPFSRASSHIRRPSFELSKTAASGPEVRVETHRGEQQNGVVISEMEPRTSDALFSILSFATATTFMLFMLPLAANANTINPPVEYAMRGLIPNIPVPDYRYFLSGGICTSISHGVSTPLDVIKTRIQSEPVKFQGLSIPAVATTILQEDGAAALLGGLGPTVIGYGMEGAAKFGLYETLKPVFSSLTSTEAVSYLGAGTAAAAFACLLLCPLEQTRIRMVTDPSFADGLVPALARMVKEEGLPTVLFGGYSAMLSKQVPYTLCRQVSFDVLAVQLYAVAYNFHLAPVDVKTEVSIAAAFLASILACIASNPGDVILTGTYKKMKGEGGEGITILPRFTDVVSMVYKTDGVAGFFSGITARFLQVGVIITSQLVLYDYIKVLLGLPATGT